MIGNLANNVGQKLQDQVAARVGGDRCREGKADNFGGDAGFGIIGHDQSRGGGAAQQFRNS